MVSFEVRQAQKMTARILLHAAVAAPCACLAQGLFDTAANDEKQRIAAAIEREQAEEGPYSIELLDPLQALGFLYQESGRHDLAAAAFERALQVVRANYGLRSLDQAPLIRQAIENEEARGNFTDAWDLEQALLTLVRGHPDDLRTVPILREVGDKRMDVADRYRAGEFPPQIALGCFYSPVRQPHLGARNCYSGSRRVATRAVIEDAWGHYADAIRVFLRNELYSSDELRELEMLLVRSAYLHGNYGVGRQSLRRLISYDVANSEPSLIRILSLVRMVDWDLVFGSNESALQAYKEVYRLLEQMETDLASIEEIFSPRVPVLLPTFWPNPLVSDETSDSAGYIDIAFDVTKYGRTRGVEILDATASEADAVENELVRLIRASHFRPRVTNGQFLDRSPVVVRYYVGNKRGKS